VDASGLAGVWDQFYSFCFNVIHQCPGVRHLPASDREDCVQEVMLEIVRKFGVVRPESLQEQLTGWIRVLSRNKAADIVRRKVRKPEVHFEDGAGAAVLDDGLETSMDAGGREAAKAEYVSLVWEALGLLDGQVSPTSYLVFYLRTIEAWSIQEIAELFQITPEQARARCHRVKKKFQAILKTHGRRRGTVGPGA
jgi:RNA polymerase sigma factor (sigma-70 family)